ncbi:hypothetical protein AAIR98_001071 [Elusimicrobium simillimum]|uniref:hypothetical protein n=1 Tax=Elusimicrobium simillimum TaxID=3143438 RepID=UPI003C6EA538
MNKILTLFLSALMLFNTSAVYAVGNNNMPNKQEIENMRQRMGAIKQKYNTYAEKKDNDLKLVESRAKSYQDTGVSEEEAFAWAANDTLAGKVAVFLTDSAAVKTASAMPTTKEIAQAVNDVKSFRTDVVRHIKDGYPAFFTAACGLMVSGLYLAMWADLGAGVWMGRIGMGAISAGSIVILGSTIIFLFCSSFKSLPEFLLPDTTFDRRMELLKNEPIRILGNEENIYAVLDLSRDAKYGKYVRQMIIDVEDFIDLNAKYGDVIMVYKFAQIYPKMEFINKENASSYPVIRMFLTELRAFDKEVKAGKYGINRIETKQVFAAETDINAETAKKTVSKYLQPSKI